MCLFTAMVGFVAGVIFSALLIKVLGSDNDENN